MNKSSPFRVIAEIIAIVALAEIAVTFILPAAAPGAGAVAKAVFDAAMLAIIAGPLIAWRVRGSVEASHGRRAVADHAVPRGPIRAAGAVLAAGLLATAFSAHWVRQSAARDAQQRFEILSERVRTEAVRRMSLLSGGLKACRDLFSGSQEVEPAEFRDYAAECDLASEFPGALAIGFIERIPGGAAAPPPIDAASEAPLGPDRYVRKFVGPASVSESIVCADFGADQAMRECLERSMRSGEPALTPWAAPHAAESSRSGFLYLLPVYRHSAHPADPSERIAACMGWVFSPVVIDQTLDGVVQAGEGMAGLRIYASPAPSESELPVSESGVQGSGRRAAFTRDYVYPIGGRRWLIRTESTPRFDAAIRPLETYAASAGGIIMSVLLCGMVWSMGTARSRAVALGTAMTAELQVATNALQEQRDRLELALSGGNLGLWDWHPQTGRLIVDQRWADMIGEDLTELRPVIEEWSSRVHPDDLPAAQTALRNHFERRTPWYECEHRLRHKDGSWRWIVDRGQVVARDREDRPVRVVGTHADVTERRRAELALAEQQARLAVFVEHAPAAIAMFDREMRYIAASARWSVEYGLGDEPLIGRSHYEVFPNISQEWKGIHQRCLAGAVERNEDDCWRPLGWDHDQHLRWEVRPWLDASGAIGGIIMLTQDITSQRHREHELARLRTAAESATAAKSAFLANMSHEIRTPLTAILGFADLLSEDGDISKAPQRRLEVIATIRRAGEHLLTVVNDILDLSKIEAGRLQIETVETDFPGLLHEVESLVRPRTIEKGVELVFRLDTPVPERLLIDPTRIRQILLNLAGNAAKFTERGRVDVVAHVRGEGEDTALVVDFKDTGPGMTDEQASRLFQPFTQADVSVTRRHGGSGLGLIICRRLSELLGGSVTLERTKPGEGSHFRFTLPVRPAPGTAWTAMLRKAVIAIAPTPMTPTLRGRILIAEDGVDNQRLIAFHLRKAGAEADIAENGRVALEMIMKAESGADGRGPYQLLVSDMQMPEMDGYTLARTLREMGSDLPIVALTAHAMAEDRRKCTDAGCDDYASKPVEKAALLATCAKWLDRRGAARSSS